MKFKILFIIVVFTYCGCTQKHEISSQSDILIRCDSFIDSNDLTFKEIIHSYEMVKLTTNDNHLISNVDKLMIENNNYYIVSDNVFSFDKDGNFKLSFSKTGKGPEEFIKLQDCSIEGDRLYLYDNFGKKVNIYNALSGEFNKEYKIIHSAHEMEILDGFVYYNRLSIPNDFVKGNEMLILHKINNPKDVLCYFDLNNYLGKMPNQLIKTGGRICWIDPISCDVYSVDKGNVFKYIDFDFGKKNVQSTDIQSGKISNNSMLRQSGKAWGLQEFYETNDFITSRFFLGENVARIIYDKISRKSLIIVGMNIKSEPQEIFDSIIASDSEYFYSVLPAHIIDRIKKNYEVNSTIFEQTNINDNPVILKYRFRRI